MERKMRMTAIMLSMLGAAMLLDQSYPAAAQSAYSYPWCAVYTDRSGAQACYYTSYGQCLATMRGIGGYCIRSPYFQGR
jgi:hypothetical protein